MATITPGSFADIKRQVNDTDEIRKSLEYILFLAAETVAVPDSIISKEGVITIPTGYWSVGPLDPKGVTIAGKTTKDEIKSGGYGRSTRVDAIAYAENVKCTVQARFKKNLESVIAGQDLSKIKPAATTGEIVWDEVSIPLSLNYRGLLLVRDINKKSGNDIVDARIWTRLSPSDKAGETIADKGARDIDLDFEVLEDESIGTPCRHVLGGKGLQEMHAQLGWADVPAAG